MNRHKRILRRGFPREIRRGWTIHHNYVPNHGSVAYAWIVTRRTARYIYVIPDRVDGRV